MNKILDYSSKLFLFKGTDIIKTENRFHLSEKATLKDYSSDELILSDDEALDGIALVVTGTAKIVSDTGDAPALLRIMTAGDSFGALSLYAAEKKYKTAVIALTDCTLLVYPSQLCREIIRAYPECAENMISFLADRISFLNNKITSFTAGSAYDKLLIYLESLPRTADGEAVLPVPCTRLTEILDIGRASLYRAFDTLCNDGKISRSGKKIYIH